MWSVSLNDKSIEAHLLPTHPLNKSELIFLILISIITMEVVKFSLNYLKVNIVISERPCYSLIDTMCGGEHPFGCDERTCATGTPSILVAQGNLPRPAPRSRLIPAYDTSTRRGKGGTTTGRLGDPLDHPRRGGVWGGAGGSEGRRRNGYRAGIAGRLLWICVTASEIYNNGRDMWIYYNIMKNTVMSSEIFQKL